MARGTTLTELLAMTKAHMGASLTVGTSMDAALYRLLASKQKWLASEWDWDFLETRYGVTTVAGTRYYTLPVGLNYDRPIKVEIQQNSRWHELQYGIGAKEYNFLDSDAGVTSSICLNWQFYGGTAGAPQYELWPIPDAVATVRFTGQANLGVLAAGSDTCTLDDELLALSVAADQLVALKQPDAQVKAAMAQQRLQRLRANLPTGSAQTVMRGGDNGRRRLRGYVDNPNVLFSDSGDAILINP